MHAYLYINSGLTCTSGWCWRPGTITHTSYCNYSSIYGSTDCVPSVTGVGGHVVGCII